MDRRPDASAQPSLAAAVEDAKGCAAGAGDVVALGAAEGAQPSMWQSVQIVRADLVPGDGWADEANGEQPSAQTPRRSQTDLEPRTKAEKGGTRRRPFTQYTLLCTTTGGRGWEVHKRYSEFKKLRAALIESGVKEIRRVQFPPKTVRHKSSVSEARVCDRQTVLQNWTNEVLELCPNHEWLAAFLDVQVHARSLAAEVGRLLMQESALRQKCRAERAAAASLQAQLHSAETAKSQALQQMARMRTEMEDMQAEIDSLRLLKEELQILRSETTRMSAIRTLETDSLNGKATVQSTPVTPVSEARGGIQSRQCTGRQTQSLPGPAFESNVTEAALLQRAKSLLASKSCDVTAVDELLEQLGKQVQQGSAKKKISAERSACDALYARRTQLCQQMRQRMRAAVGTEEDAGKLSDLLVESMAFGAAIESDREALQKRFENLLRIQAMYDPAQSIVKDLRHIDC